MLKEPMEKVISDLKLTVQATGNYLAFLQNIGKKHFRVNVAKTDEELAKYIEENNVNLMQMAREHLLAWKWINQTGRLAMFEEYRREVRAALEADQVMQSKEKDGGQG